MDSLKELREWFLEDPETRAAAFKIADYYLVSYADDREELVGGVLGRTVAEFFCWRYTGGVMNIVKTRDGFIPPFFGEHL